MEETRNINWLERTELLLGEEQINLLKQKHVLVVGLGGVGSAAAEMIVRAGIGHITIVDGDVVNTSNRNRQLLALCSTVGKRKVEVMKERLLDINPELNIIAIDEYLREEAIKELLSKPFDYVVDAIDTLLPKINLIKYSLELKHPLVSSMGAGGRLDPSKIKVADISKSYNDNLARMLRKRLHKIGIYDGFRVVFSCEKVDRSTIVIEESENKKSNVGTISFMPPVFGIFIASVVVRDLLGVIID
jgi:tRNA A37 threonylcarbamoyladenosine dehydratase